VTVWAEFETFAETHREQGPLAVISGPLDADGYYDVDTACPCGASLSRRVSLQEALKDLGVPPTTGKA
jgi:hypothetical protein